MGLKYVKELLEKMTGGGYRYSKLYEKREGLEKFLDTDVGKELLPQVRMSRSAKKGGCSINNERFEALV